MSNKEKAIQLLDTIDEEKMIYVVGILENLTGFVNASDMDIPNRDTLEAFQESDELLANRTGQRFEGTTEDFFKMLLEE